MNQPDTYASALDVFLDGIASGAKKIDVPTIFHAVRKIRYASRGNRNPWGVLTAREGSCSGKHILLRDLLRHVGEKAEVEIVEGDFAAGLPVVASMPEALRRWIRDGGIRDYHNYVVWHAPTGERKLDATWHDALEPFGFAVNSGWTGEGDTALALKPRQFMGRPEDVIQEKALLVASLGEEDAGNRRAFLELLTEWIAKSA